MAMAAATLSTQIRSMTPTTLEATGIQHFADAWSAYFADSAANGVSYTANAAHKLAMISAMAGASAPSAGAAKIQAGVVAWWGSVVSTFAATYSGSIALAPPPLITGIAALLTPVLAANTADGLSLNSCCDAVANVLHANNLGGIATFPPAIAADVQ